MRASLSTVRPRMWRFFACLPPVLNHFVTYHAGYRYAKPCANPPYNAGLRYALCGGSLMRLEAVGKRYGARSPWVVRGVSADLRDGRLIRVSGRNGSGKSTLLRVVAGVSLPSAGRV